MSYRDETWHKAHWEHALQPNWAFFEYSIYIRHYYVVNLLCREIVVMVTTVGKTWKGSIAG